MHRLLSTNLYNMPIVVQVDGETLSSEMDLPWCYHRLGCSLLPPRSSADHSLHLGELIRCLRIFVTRIAPYLTVPHHGSMAQRSDMWIRLQ